MRARLWPLALVVALVGWPFVVVAAEVLTDAAGALAPQLPQVLGGAIGGLVGGILGGARAVRRDVLRITQRAVATHARTCPGKEDRK